MLDFSNLNPALESITDYTEKVKVFCLFKNPGSANLLQRPNILGISLR